MGQKILTRILFIEIIIFEMSRSNNHVNNTKYFMLFVFTNSSHDTFICKNAKEIYRITKVTRVKIYKQANHWPFNK